jgi:hypothetical protein
MKRCWRSAGKIRRRWPLSTGRIEEISKPSSARRWRRPGAAVQFGGRFGGGYPALSGGRADRCAAAQHGVSTAEVRGRHRALVTGMAAVFVVLVGGIVASTWQAVRADRAGRAALAERDRGAAAEQAAAKECDRALSSEQAATERAEQGACCRGSGHSGAKSGGRGEAAGRR